MAMFYENILLEEKNKYCCSNKWKKRGIIKIKRDIDEDQNFK